MSADGRVIPNLRVAHLAARFDKCLHGPLVEEGGVAPDEDVNPGQLGRQVQRRQVRAAAVVVQDQPPVAPYGRAEQGGAPAPAHQTQQQQLAGTLRHARER